MVLALLVPSFLHILVFDGLLNEILMYERGLYSGSCTLTVRVLCVVVNSLLPNHYNII